MARKHVDESVINDENDLNKAIVHQNVRQQKYARRHLQKKRAAAILTLLFMAAAYVQWHVSGGQQHYILDILIIGSLIHLFVEAVMNTVRPRP